MIFFKVDGTVQYIESFHATVNGSGVVSIPGSPYTSNHANAADNGLGLITTSTNTVTIEINHASYRMNGLVFKIKK